MINVKSINLIARAWATISPFRPSLTEGMDFFDIVDVETSVSNPQMWNEALDLDVKPSQCGFDDYFDQNNYCVYERVILTEDMVNLYVGETFVANANPEYTYKIDFDEDNASVSVQRIRTVDNLSETFILEVEDLYYIYKYVSGEATFTPLEQLLVQDDNEEIEELE